MKCTLKVSEYITHYSNTHAQTSPHATVYLILQYEHHLLLQCLQCIVQSRLDLAVVVLMVNLSCLHRQHILIMHLMQFMGSLYVPLFSLVTLFICKHTTQYRKGKARYVMEIHVFGFKPQMKNKKDNSMKVTVHRVE